MVAWNSPSLTTALVIMRLKVAKHVYRYIRMYAIKKGVRKRKNKKKVLFNGIQKKEDATLH